MTREEAIDILFGVIAANSEEENEALDMAIEALTQDSRKVTQESTQDLISRAEAIEAVENNSYGIGSRASVEAIKALPSAESTHREKALLLLLDWAVECGFGYDNIPEEYATYEKNIENMGYMEGLIYIAEREVEQNE